MGDKGNINQSVALILPIQCRMARAATGRGVRELSSKAGIVMDTVVRFEGGATVRPRAVNAIRSALEAAGVEFIEENGDGPGVRLRQPSQDSRQCS